MSAGSLSELLTAQLMYVNGLADTIASDKYGGHIFEMTRVTDQDGKTVRGAFPQPLSSLWRPASRPLALSIVCTCAGLRLQCHRRSKRGSRRALTGAFCLA